MHDSRQQTCALADKKKDEIEVERVCDCVVVCNGMRKNIRKMEVVEDFVSRPHQHVRFEARSEDLACPTAVARRQRGKNVQSRTVWKVPGM